MRTSSTRRARTARERRRHHPHERAQPASVGLDARAVVQPPADDERRARGERPRQRSRATARARCRRRPSRWRSGRPCSRMKLKLNACTSVRGLMPASMKKTSKHRPGDVDRRLEHAGGDAERHRERRRVRPHERALRRAEPLQIQVHEEHQREHGEERLARRDDQEPGPEVAPHGEAERQIPEAADALAQAPAAERVDDGEDEGRDDRDEDRRLEVEHQREERRGDDREAEADHAVDEAGEEHHARDPRERPRGQVVEAGDHARAGSATRREARSITAGILPGGPWERSRTQRGRAGREGRAPARSGTSGSPSAAS